MKIERTKNASRNILFGVVLKIYQILIPFVMRSAMIYVLGFQYLGLNSLFTSVLQVLNLAELGVGSAMIYSMYKPIAEDDSHTICSLMKLYRTYYFFIGLILAIFGTIITPFIPRLINGSVPNDINVYILYLLNLFATVLSYWLFAYKNSILQAHQRTDIISKVTLVTNSIQYIMQLISLIVFKNYYLFVVSSLLSQAVTNITTAFYANKYYPNYKPVGNIDNVTKIKINGRIKDLFTSKVGAVILNSTDTIVISTFLGLTVLAIYQNYFFVITSIIGIISIIYSSCLAGIGNSLIVESKEKNFEDLNNLTFIISWISGFCSCCLLCLFQPFMTIWTGINSLLPYSVVIMLVIYFYIYEQNQLLNLYKDAAGIWHEDRFRPLITSLVNLALNLMLVQFIGIYGIILSTVASILIVGLPWLFHNLFSTIFYKKFLYEYIKKIIKYLFICIFVCAITWIICNLIKFDGVIAFIIKILICCIVSNFCFFICYRKTKEFNFCWKLLLKIKNKKLQKTNKIDFLK